MPATLQTTLRFNIRKGKSKNKKLNNENGSELADKTSETIQHTPGRRNRRRGLQPATDDNLVISNVKDGECDSPPKRGRQNLVGLETSPSTLLSRVSLLDKENSPTKKDLKQTPESTRNDFTISRRSLHTSHPVGLPGREKEIAEIKKFLEKHLVGGPPGSLYISGAPGTGKTACVRYVLQTKKAFSLCQHIYLNCTSLRTPSALFGQIAKLLNPKVSFSGEKDAQAQLEKMITNRKNMILVVLDEVDQLASKSQSILYSVFEWPALRGSKAVLIGIANALDLTDRVLPRLKVGVTLCPRLLHFAPYSKQQLLNILFDRLNQAENGSSKTFCPKALQLVAGKVAAVSGDARRALDISRRALEIAAVSNQRKGLSATVDDGNNTGSPRKSLSVSVGIQQVVSVLDEVYGSRIQSTSSNGPEFPLQQRVLLCCLLRLTSDGRNHSILVGKLHETFSRVCRSRNLLAIDQSELISLCSLLETRGVICLQRAKETRLSKVSLNVDRAEVEAAVQDKHLLSSILKETIN